LNLKIKIKINFWKFGKWARAFGRNGCIAPPTLGSANSSKIHGEWRVHLFQKRKFLNLVHTWTFLSTVGIFVS
jgi:hypothetical protein